MPITTSSKNFGLIAIILLLSYLSACKATAPTTSVQSWPIKFDDDRVQLSLDYIQDHYGEELNYPVIDPQMIVVHWTAIPTLQASFEAFYDSRLPESRTKISGASPLNVSVPYLIDRDGTTFQLMPDTLFARHVIGLNHCAIGIENVGNGSNHPLTEDQFEANEKLIRILVEKYDIRYVIGHHEYQQFNGHPLWKERDANYLTQKSDPGDAFMHRLRSQLSDLDLLPIPGEVTIKQGVAGQVRWFEGNLMPTIGEDISNSNGTPVQRTLRVYELTNREQAQQQESFFHDLPTKKLAEVITDSTGYFQVPLPPGNYSILVEEKEGLFANQFDGQGNIAPFKVLNDSVTEIKIRVDYRAAY